MFVLIKYDITQDVYGSPLNVILLSNIYLQPLISISIDSKT